MFSTQHFNLIEQWSLIFEWMYSYFFGFLLGFLGKTEKGLIFALLINNRLHHYYHRYHRWRQENRRQMPPANQPPCRRTAVDGQFDDCVLCGESGRHLQIGVSGCRGAVSAPHGYQSDSLPGVPPVPPWGGAPHPGDGTHHHHHRQHSSRVPGSQPVVRYFVSVID